MTEGDRGLPSMEDVIVEALLSNEREAQILAARELGKLATKLRQKLAERGIISRLVTMLRTQDYEATEAALCALLCLAFHSERYCLHQLKFAVFEIASDGIGCRIVPHLILL